MKPTWPRLLVVLLLAGVGTSAGARAAEPAARPNVLFIAVDDLNMRVGCFGDPIVKTPNLDRLAERGVRFERAYCQFPLCNPSRVSLLLGRYPTTTETIDFARPALLGRDWVTLTEYFRNFGYDVQLRGKIYHYPEPKPWSAGEEAVRKEQEIHRRNMADLTRWEPYRTLAPPPTQLGRNVANRQHLPAGPQVAERIDEEQSPGLPLDGRREERPAGGGMLRALGAWSGKPFFLGLGFYKPHVPLVVPQKYFDLYPPEKMPLPPDFAPRPTADDSVPRYALRYNLDLFYEERPTPAAGEGRHRRLLRLHHLHGRQVGAGARRARSARTARQHA